MPPSISFQSGIPLLKVLFDNNSKFLIYMVIFQGTIPKGAHQHPQEHSREEVFGYRSEARGLSLSLIIQTSLLKEHGVELRHLSADHIQTDCTKVVYLVRSQPNLMRHICSNIHHDESKGLQREYHVYFVPRRTVVCEKVLEEEKLHNMVTIGEYPLYIVPMDEDVLSFELDLAYKVCCWILPFLLFLIYLLS
nr:vacuolar protein-sorting-associated protein 33 homolog [Arachis hypogaea]XP_025621372.1 vacuolar protein-sorting-associated protein 33 homolog [Arachis hypogaea]